MIKSFPIEKSRIYRENLSFINRSVRVKNEYGGGSDTYPCIVLVDIKLNVVVAYTGYEKFVCYESYTDNANSGSTLANKAINVCKFLNYILHNTDLNSVNECELSDIRNFLITLKTKKDGTEYAEDTWIRMRDNVINFLKVYYSFYNSKIKFNYDGNELQKLVLIRDEAHRRKVKLINNSALGIKAPKSTHKKNRFLEYGYLELLIYEAKKYDPMIALAIAFQAYAGLREGSVMNLTVGRIKIKRGAFSALTNIELDINNPAPFWLHHNYKTNPAEIKKPRTQLVYNDFISDVNQMFEDHISYMEYKKYDTSKNAPLFLNKQGKPLTEFTYRSRVKDLFYNHFLPSLRKTCIVQNTWIENAAYIEAYEEEYPGAHMLRHWFTMYLLTKAKLEVGQIRKWRGDDSETAMLEYIHANSDIIDAYKASTYRFMKSVLEGINSDE